MKTRICLWSMLVLTMSLINFTTSQAANHSFQWETQDWGKLGIVHLQNAPFPDESRMNGYTRDSVTYPYEGHYDDNAVAVVIPPGFKPSSKINFVVIFHGHVGTADKFITSFSIGSVYNLCDPNAILVVPQGPKLVPDSGGGKMEKPEGFANMMKELLAALKEDGKVPASANFGNLIVGAYSGGFRPLGFSIHHGGMAPYIKEVWLFDAAYGFQDYLSEPFATPGTKNVLRALFTDHQAHENYRIMSNIGKSGNKLVFVVDEDLSRTTTTKEDYNACSVHTEGSYPGDDELLRVCKQNSLVYIHTALPHDGLAFTKRFLADFIMTSPWLKKNTPPKTAAEDKASTGKGNISVGGSVTVTGEWKKK